MLLEHSRRFWILISRFLFNSLSRIVSFVSVRLSCRLGKIPLQLIDYWLVATSHTGLKRWRAFCCYGCNGMGMHMARLDFSVFLLLLRPSSYDDVSWMDCYGYGWMDGWNGWDRWMYRWERPAGVQTFYIYPHLHFGFFLLLVLSPWKYQFFRTYPFGFGAWYQEGVIDPGPWGVLTTKERRGIRSVAQTY